MVFAPAFRPGVIPASFAQRPWPLRRLPGPLVLAPAIPGRKARHIAFHLSRPRARATHRSTLAQARFPAFAQPRAQPGLPAALRLGSRPAFPALPAPKRRSQAPAWASSPRAPQVFSHGLCRSGLRPLRAALFPGYMSGAAPADSPALFPHRARDSCRRPLPKGSAS